MAAQARDIVSALLSGEASSEEAVERIEALVAQARGFSDMGFARPDVSRAGRQGAGEVIYGEGKSPEQVAAIARALLEAGQPGVLVTRLSPEKAQALRALWEPCDGAAPAPLEYLEAPRLAIMGSRAPVEGDGAIVVACAGTSDLPVAEEAACTAEFLGNRVERCYDVGVAGIHRLLASRAALESARVVIAVAGMEGALASVVGGLVRCPVIGVPTSVGYGASFDGLSALLCMLNSCASGVSVVNIDNGFGAAFQASLINHL